MIKSNSLEESKSNETTIISSGVKIDGKITSSGNIRVEGEIKGDISSQRDIVVGERGKVNGQINADSITIGGMVSGTVKADNKLALNSGGHLKGNIFTKILVIEAGARFDGESKMGDSGDIWKTKEPDKTESNIKK